MEEKERYEFGQRTLFYSGEELTTFDGFNLDDFMRIICRLLNQQDKEIIKLRQENQQLKQSQKQLAISELEKLREYIVLNDEYDEEIGCNIIKTFDLIEGLADKIKSLKGEE